MKKYVDIHNKNHCFFDIICVVKVNGVQYIKHRPMTNLDFKNIKIRCDFPQILEFRTTFASCHNFTTYDYYSKQPMHMVERRLNMNIAKNPNLVNFFDRFHNHPLIRKCSHIPFIKK